MQANSHSTVLVLVMMSTLSSWRRCRCRTMEWRGGSMTTLMLIYSWGYFILFYTCVCSLVYLILTICCFLILAETYCDHIVFQQGFYVEVATPLLTDVTMIYLGGTNLTRTNFSQYYHGSEIVVAGQIIDNNVETFVPQVVALSVSIDPHCTSAGIFVIFVVFTYKELLGVYCLILMFDFTLIIHVFLGCLERRHWN